MKRQKTRYRKIRGINRRKRAIEQWGDNRESLDIDLLNREKRDYVKFRVQPWSRLSLISSIYPEPTDDCEYLLIKNLQKIYRSWQNALESMQTPYYLQIWLYEEYISRSQVVCAIENYRDFYRNIFEPVNVQPKDSIQTSIHYNANTAKYLDCHIWQLSRHIQTYDMTNENDMEILQNTDPKKIIRTEIIEGKKHQVVEINKVWLVL